jgi:ankyrin repeat domain-containing protein 13
LQYNFQIAIPIVPTIRVLVTFTKFEELQSSADEFATPPSSPTQFQDSSKVTKDQDRSNSWYSWVKGSRGGSSSELSDDRGLRDEPDPFIIPTDYTWVDANEKKRRLKAKRKSKKASSGKKQASSRSSEGRQLMDGFE